eukprot:5612953-Prymnesium_polylepis.1
MVTSLCSLKCVCVCVHSYALAKRLDVARLAPLAHRSRRLLAARTRHLPRAAAQRLRQQVEHLVLALKGQRRLADAPGRLGAQVAQQRVVRRHLAAAPVGAPREVDGEDAARHEREDLVGRERKINDRCDARARDARRARSVLLLLLCARVRWCLARRWRGLLCSARRGVARESLRRIAGEQSSWRADSWASGWWHMARGRLRTFGRAVRVHPDDGRTPAHHFPRLLRLGHPPRQPRHHIRKRRATAVAAACSLLALCSALVVVARRTRIRRAAATLDDTSRRAGPIGASTRVAFLSAVVIAATIPVAIPAANAEPAAP